MKPNIQNYKIHFVCCLFHIVFVLMAGGHGHAGEITEGITNGNWIDIAADDFAGGLGTKATPYLIETPEQLAHLAKFVNDGNNCKELHFKLTKDIDLGERNWTPIGDSNSKYAHFAGFFDGNNQKIENLKIHQNTRSLSGLFGCLETGIVENVAVINCDIKSSSYAGGIASYSFVAMIKNCYVSGNIEGNVVGGIVGLDSSGEIVESAANIRLSMNKQFKTLSMHDFEPAAGGLVGKLLSISGRISDCTVSVTIEGFSENGFPDVGALWGWKDTHEVWAYQVERCHIVRADF